MTIRNLGPLLHPRSVALIGASAKAGSIGKIVLANLLDGGFEGTVHAVNPNPLSIDGATWVPTIEALPTAPDLAIVMTPAQSVPGIIGQLGALGTRNAVVISAGITPQHGLRQRMLDAARPYLLRIIGPNCLGVLMPRAKVNASFVRTAAKPGRLALISQSGALVTAILDWAASRDIGFSGIVSVGDMADVDIGDLIDLFATDEHTDTILIYVEGVTNPAKFMSAARAAARIKPVIAIKAGRSLEAGKAALSHTGALAGSYDVYQAAFHRAGIVMVETLTELFDAAEVLGKTRLPRGNRLAIITNGGGAGILAVDALAETEGRLAGLSPASLAALDSVLPPAWSHGDPVDIIGDAPADRYRIAVDTVLRDEAVDALLVMNCPTALSSSTEVATTVADAVTQARTAGLVKPVLTCWLGDANSDAARPVFANAGIPLFSTPDDAVRGFSYLLAAKRAREQLFKEPSSSREVICERETATGILAQARKEGRTLLDEIEAKALLACYGVPAVPTRFAASTEAIAEACAGLTPPFAVKIVSPHLTHKSDVGGVVLNLPDAAAAVTAATTMRDRIAREHPEAVLSGFAIEQMCVRPHAQELIVGVSDDATFGPVLMVGAGGTAVELLRDRALGLPPLDAGMARELIAKTRIARLLDGYRGVPAANVEAVAQVLEALSAMMSDLPDIVELDINPLLVDAEGVIALDARIRITPEADAISRLVIRPAPMQWAADLVTRTGLRTHVRPVRPDDEAALGDLFAHVTPEDLRYRFLSGLRVVDHERLAVMTQVDYRRTITFLAFAEDGTTVIAAATLAADPDRERAELALATRADMKGRGVSWTLLEHVLRYAQAEGIGVVESIESADHEVALRMEREMGFTPKCDPDDPTIRIARRVLHDPVSQAAGAPTP